MKPFQRAVLLGMLAVLLLGLNAIGKQEKKPMSEAKMKKLTPVLIVEEIDIEVMYQSHASVEKDVPGLVKWPLVPTTFLYVGPTTPGGESSRAGAEDIRGKSACASPAATWCSSRR